MEEEEEEDKEEEDPLRFGSHKANARAKKYGDRP